MIENIKEEFTAKQKSIITNDWCELLTSFVKNKNLYLFNRIGPLVVGIWLKMGRSNRFYVPIYYVHNLCNEFPYSALSISLRIEGKVVKPEHHNQMYMKEAETLVKNAYIAIDGDLHIDDIIKGYERYFENPILDSYLEYEDFALICGWTKDRNRIQYALNTVYEQLRLWPEERYFSRHGGFENWFAKLEERTWDGDKLNQIYESELVNHKLTQIPQRNIIV